MVDWRSTVIWDGVNRSYRECLTEVEREPVWGKRPRGWVEDEESPERTEFNEKGWVGSGWGYRKFRGKFTVKKYLRLNLKVVKENYVNNTLVLNELATECVIWPYSYFHPWCRWDLRVLVCVQTRYHPQIIWKLSVYGLLLTSTRSLVPPYEVIHCTTQRS